MGKLPQYSGSPRYTTKPGVMEQLGSQTKVMNRLFTEEIKNDIGKIIQLHYKKKKGILFYIHIGKLY